MKVSQVDVEVDSLIVPCTVKDLKANFGWLLIEMRGVAKLLRPEEREALRTIMNNTGRTLTVRDVFPQFKRDGAEHSTLRRLRAGKFVRPATTGRWEPNEPIEPTPFARLMWDRIGEARIFSFSTAKPISAPVDVSTPPPKRTPVTWDNLLERIHEQQKRTTSSPTPTQEK